MSQSLTSEERLKILDSLKRAIKSNQPKPRTKFVAGSPSVEDKLPPLRTTEAISHTAPNAQPDNFASLLLPKATDEYHPLSFLTNPILFHAYFDDNVQKGNITYYQWQAETGIFLAGTSYTQQEPLYFHLCACNGSGKDAYVLSLFAVWHAATKIRSRCIITSASYQQLDTQTEAYIRALCERVNLKLSAQGICAKAFEIKKQHIVCNLTGSEIKLFATDEGQKAEGYHPFPDYPGAEMAIIVNEAKSVKPVIYDALRRCTGYNRWIEVSSPGPNSGDFFEHCSKAIKYPMPYEAGKRYFRRVTAYDCKHFSKMEIEEAQKEMLENGRTWLFKSLYLAEFTSEGEMVIIPMENLISLFEANVPWDNDTKKVGGLDLSLGGDETVLTVREGNRVVGYEPMKIRDAVMLTQYLDTVVLPKYGFVKSRVVEGRMVSGTPINTDIGGLGEPIAHMLQNLFWNIIFVRNNSASVKKLLYKDRATEGWFHLANLISRKAISIKRDPRLESQLCSRLFYSVDGLKVKLESKADAKARGISSPDRADSFELAFKDFTPSSFRAEDKARYHPEGLKVTGRITQTTLIKQMEDERYRGLNQTMALGITRVGGPKRGDQRSWLAQQIKDHNQQYKQ